MRAKIDAFTDGLQIISDASSFLQLFALSMVMWVLVAVSYWLITACLRRPARASLDPPASCVLMVAAMFGSLLQLPGVGGGSQLATIAVLNGIFGVDNEVAVSCGMLIWLAPSCR